jgi:hypothetical protein
MTKRDQLCSLADERQSRSAHKRRSYEIADS